LRTSVILLSLFRSSDSNSINSVRPLSHLFPSLVLAEVIAVAGRVIIVRDSLERVKVVFVMQIEDRSSVIDRRVIKLCVVL
jgi:hypothetical protein